MPFERETNVTKVGIEDFEIRLFSPGPNNTNDSQSGSLAFQILMSDGTIKPKEVKDLLARLQDDLEGQELLTRLVDLRDYVRARLEAEVLP